MTSTAFTTAQTIIKTASKALLLIGISPLLPAIGVMWALSAFEPEAAENSSREITATGNSSSGYAPESQIISLNALCG